MSKTLKDPDEALLRQFTDLQRRLEAIERRPRKVATVKRTTTQSIGGGGTGHVKTIFESIVIDTDGCFDFSAPTKLTAKTPGIYIVVANLTMVSNATHHTWFALQKSAAGIDPAAFVASLGSMDQGPVSGFPGKGGTLTAVVPMDRDDYVEALVKQDDGSPRNLDPSAGPVTMSIILIA